MNFKLFSFMFGKKIPVKTKIGPIYMHNELRYINGIY